MKEVKIGGRIGGGKEGSREMITVESKATEFKYKIIKSKSLKLNWKQPATKESQVDLA